jgi:hypothetical protein
MSDVGGIGNRSNHTIVNQNRVGEKSVGQPVDTPIGPPGSLGQPTGLPVTDATGNTPIISDVLTGKDPSQLIAAEQLRSTGGASATEELLGLNQQPTMLGAFPSPPGNAEALRHMTPSIRRNIMRSLITKQKDQMRRLTSLLRDQREKEDKESEHRKFNEEGLLDENASLESDGFRNACDELQRMAHMLDLVDELLAMQDYTLSQMNSFSKG